MLSKSSSIFSFSSVSRIPYKNKTNKATDGPSAVPAASLHLDLLSPPLLPPPAHPTFLSSSVVLSRDAGGTLVLVFIPTWLTSRLLTTILTLTKFFCKKKKKSGDSALLLT